MDIKLRQLLPNLFHFKGVDEIYFSYETPIAFYHPQEETVYISENVWSRTTGKHINHIKRTVKCYYEQVPHEQFKEMLRGLTS